MLHEQKKRHSPHFLQAMPLISEITQDQLCVVLNVFDNVADRLDVLDLLVGDLNVELFLEGHDQIDQIQRICAEVIDDAGLHRYLFILNIELVNQNLFYFVKNHGYFLLEFQ